ncbi:MAG TPA: hypothetical protein VNS50_04280 [Ginsengibacter sp.]|nr:hypothetical protein [Ginsengibacter sp.]
MSALSKYKKVFIRGAIILLTIIICSIGILYYLVVHKFKESIQYVVNKESNGKYEFKADKANLSLFQKTITLTNAHLICRDTINVDKHYDVTIPNLYFSIASFKTLILNKKLIIDSLAITEPNIYIHVHKDAPVTSEDQAAFQTADILNLLENTLARFNAHLFSIQDLSFTYAKVNGPAPLHGDHISIKVVNFTKVDNNDLHILGSDTIAVSLGRQHWVFPDGIHEVSFSKFIFLSHMQRIELDSFMFRQKATASTAEVLLEGDKFFFNSKHFPTIYQKDELIVDTLFTLNPVLTIIGPGGNTKATKDTAIKEQAAHELFKFINIKFIDVINGEFYLKNSYSDTSGNGVHKSNATIYNLVIDNENNKRLTTDSIKVNLKNIEIYSPDSLSKLRIRDFTLMGKNAVFNNVEYLPSEYDKYKRGITFTAPALQLQDIDFSELMHERFKAVSAKLTQPSFLVYNKNKPGAPQVRAKPVKGEEKMALFFRSLHHIKELLDVENFNVANGSASYKIEGVKPLKLSAQNLNATFLLNKLFVSDSLIDVKNSIPDFRMGVLNLSTKNLQVKVSNYKFDSATRSSLGDQLLITTENGTTLKGKDIYWEDFDWDVYKNTKDIQIDYLRIGDLKINTTSKADVEQKPEAPKDLPVLRLAKLQINRLSFKTQSSKSTVYLYGNDLIIENIKSISHFFVWDNAKVHLYNISSISKNTTISIKDIPFNTNKETLIKQVYVESDNGHGKTKISAPSIDLKMDLRSTDFSQLVLQNLVADNVSVHLFSTPVIPDSPHVSKTAKIPVALLLQNASLKHLAVEYTKATKKDTAAFHTVLNIKATGVQTYKDSNQLLAYKDIEVNLDKIAFNRETLHMNLSNSKLHLSNGSAVTNAEHKLALASAINFGTNGTDLHYAKDSSSFSVNKFDIAFKDNNFKLNPGQKLSLQKLLAKTTFKGEGFSYEGKKVTVAVKSYSLDQSGRAFSITQFNITPKLNRKEYFDSAKWQNDYILTKGTSLTFSGITFNNSADDSILRIKKITADGLDLNTSRDKTIPFQHGIKKLMPTELIDNIKMPLQVDTILLRNADVTYNEFSVGTKKWSTLPLTDINGTIVNISNQHKANDSLKIAASIKLLGNDLRKFTYSESYQDSLSGFTAEVQASDFNLASFSKFSKPLAAVAITKGVADTFYSSWKGNKYAAYGTMNFQYHDLKIKIYSKKDTSKQGLIPSFKTWVANLVLPSKKSKSSLIYFERDQEKFVFNFWIKSQVSGVLSAMGIKKDKKYKAQYAVKAGEFSLPKQGF